MKTGFFLENGELLDIGIRININHSRGKSA
jgi:hypothetical protein